MNLYQLDDEIRLVLTLTDDDGVLTDEAYEWFKNLNMEREQIVEIMLIDIKESTAEAEALKKEEESLRERRKRLEKRIERTKQELVDYVEGERISTPRASLGWRKSTAVAIDDEALIPSEFVTVETVQKIDKQAIKEALGEQDVPGARLEVRNNPQIR